jgi:hypothetical protein
VKIRYALRDELLAVRSSAQNRHLLDPDAFVFATSEGRRFGAENFRNRVLAAAVKRANENLAKRELAPVPAKITPHSLRRIFCSLCTRSARRLRSSCRKWGTQARLSR